jgi:hypothetical protein
MRQRERRIGLNPLIPFELSEAEMLEHRTYYGPSRNLADSFQNNPKNVAAVHLNLLQ